jgi:hypothetical protein
MITEQCLVLFSSAREFNIETSKTNLNGMLAFFDEIIHDYKCYKGCKNTADTTEQHVL